MSGELLVEVAKEVAEFCTAAAVLRDPIVAESLVEGTGGPSGFDVAAICELAGT